MKRRSAIFSILAASILAVGLIFGLKAHEPEYEGRALNDWVDDYLRNSVYFFGSEIITSSSTSLYGLPVKTDRQKAIERAKTAIKSIGVKGVPNLLRRASTGELAWSQAYDKLRIEAPEWAEKMLPETRPLLNPEIAGRLMAESGAPAIPLLISSLKSPNPDVRVAATVALGNLAENGLDLSRATDELAALLEDLSTEVSRKATYSLGQIGPAASNAIPALLESLKTHSREKLSDERLLTTLPIIVALGKIGPAASNAIPAVTLKLKYRDSYVQATAATALWQIDPDNESAQAIANETFTKSNISSKQEWIEVLAKAGAGAKPAWPLLIREFEISQVDYQRTLTNAMFKIDPEAAAKLLH